MAKAPGPLANGGAPSRCRQYRRQETCVAISQRRYLDCPHMWQAWTQSTIAGA